jgi:hypothetical protein
MEELKQKIKDNLAEDFRDVSLAETYLIADSLSYTHSQLIDLLIYLKKEDDMDRKKYHCESYYDLILRIFDIITDNHGIEYQAVDMPNSEDAPQALLFSNSGDTYNATLIYVVECFTNAGTMGYLDYSSIGDILEPYL